MPPHTTAEKVADLRERIARTQEPGDAKAIAKRDAKGIPSARARIHALLDKGSFLELGAFGRTPGDPNAPYTDGVVTGLGRIDDRPVAVFSHDQTVYQGSVGEMFGRKVAKLMEWAATNGCPVIGINDSAGARIQDTATSLAWYAELGRRHEMLRGMVPEISLIFGKCAGGAVYSPIQTDLVVAVRDQGYMFITGPDVIKDVTGEDVTFDELGGADVQAQRGNIHKVVEDEAAAYQYVRDYLSFLPSNTFDYPPIVNPGLEPEITEDDLYLDTIIPDADNQGYDMHEVLLRIFDDGDVFEIADQRSPSMITAFARVDGSPVGVIANQPMHMSGAVGNEASDKAAGFIRFCDSFNLPLVFVVDTPGAMPGVEEETNGVIKRGGRFFNAVVEADVPKVTIITRKAYGGGYAVMGSKQLSADLNFAWPTARIAVIGAEGAAQLLVKRFPDPTAPEVRKIRQDFIDGYNKNLATPWIAAERGYIDGVIEPHQTRLLLRQSLKLLRDKQNLGKVQRKHGLTPI
ncbi:methylmalonyl-CoA carboxyltransferase [Mycobacteroides chelonae]|uniref:Methylmalonyl-CoA carboxyltransferase n=1 Tax=Mycobacteroides chelonae TaxID=1774 RepID=A0A1S1KTN4_MYCCH|nr:MULTISPECIES: acyl-CoA carboxylase subunit beta [Mycobacteroides]AMW17965.1 propionyl-CoA carboxylase subunit beta [Mycobacterium sp. QIA-37]PKQ56660.1 methylmalonyl-CoA carboxyltransferase [Mycobacterium sp. MHSD3]SKM94371.1 Propionyl-CoA carboxylase, beta subunit (PccB) [Mycobacteroides abscessus subsp. bolletii]AYM40296.1 acyl-CoA carboxylase subunit beta [[Mycobacterium] chelonae subsp. gwanakae]KRQ20186.1 methylmalonyl-CoA carboxyltransferase [Mycobacteroides sp. H003]